MPIRRSAMLLTRTMDPCDPYPQACADSPEAPKTPVEKQWEALYGHLQPVIERLLLQYPAAAEGEAELRGTIRSRYFELVEAHDPASGIPLRPYLVRMLTAWVYTVACYNGDLRRAEERFRNEFVPSLAEGQMEEAQGVLTALPAAISRLPRKERLTVIGRYYEGRSCEEVAAALAVEPEVVRALLRRALARLRRRLADDRVTG